MDDLFDNAVDRWNTRSVKWDGMEAHYGTRDAVPMWVADMDFPSPPEVVDALKQRAEHGVFGYTIRPDSFYDAIMAWMRNRHGFFLEKEWITQSPGVVAGIGLIVEALTAPGDKVIIQPPVYHPFRHILEVKQREVVENPLRLQDGRYTIDFDDLEEKAKSGAKLLILCSPHNPVGRVWTREELERVGDICLRHDIFVISDEIHGDLIYKPYRHTPFASLSPAFAKNSITCIAPSKTFNLAGLQTAVLIVPDEGVRERVNTMIDHTFVGGANAFGVVALEAAYTHGGPWLDALMDYLAGILDDLTHFIEQRIPAIKVIQPEGTYLVWLDCRELGLAAKELDDFMLHKAKIALNEGHIFGVQGEGFQRMNIGCPRSLLVQGLETLADAVQSLAY